VTFDSIFKRDVQQGLSRRLATLQPDSQPRWGRVSSDQAVCHLTDAFRLVLGERPTTFRAGLLLKVVGRVVALAAPDRPDRSTIDARPRCREHLPIDWRIGASATGC
jgi:hypothetical protein